MRPRADSSLSISFFFCNLLSAYPSAYLILDMSILTQSPRRPMHSLLGLANLQNQLDSKGGVIYSSFADSKEDVPNKIPQ